MKFRLERLTPNQEQHGNPSRDMVAESNDSQNLVHLDLRDLIYRSSSKLWRR